MQNEKLGFILTRKFRSSTAEKQNNAVRTELLKALGNAFGLNDGVVFNTINSWGGIPDLNNLTVLDQDAFEEIQEAAIILSRANRSGYDVTMNSKRSLVDCLNKMTKEVHDAFEEELRDEKASPLANAVKKNIFLALAMGEFAGKYTPLALSLNKNYSSLLNNKTQREFLNIILPAMKEKSSLIK